MSSEWLSCKLGDLIAVKHGFAFKSEYFSEEPTSYQLVTPGNFTKLSSETHYKYRLCFSVKSETFSFKI